MDRDVTMHEEGTLIDEELLTTPRDWSEIFCLKVDPKLLTNAGSGAIVVGVGGSVGAGVLFVLGGAAGGFIVLGATGVHRTGVASALYAQKTKFTMTRLEQLLCLRFTAPPLS